jgi:hypothetical protein
MMADLTVMKKGVGESLACPKCLDKATLLNSVETQQK